MLGTNRSVLVVLVNELSLLLGHLLVRETQSFLDSIVLTSQLCYLVVSRWIRLLRRTLNVGHVLIDLGHQFRHDLFAPRPGFAQE